MGTLNIGGFRPGTPSDGGSGVLNQLLKFGLDTVNSNRAQTALEKILNPVQKTEVLKDISPQQVEAANAQDAIKQGGLPQPAASPAPDFGLSTQPDMAQNLEGVLSPKQPLATQITDTMPAPQQRMVLENRAPKLGDSDYRSVPRGLSADAYDALAKSEMTPSMDKLLASAVQQGKDLSGIQAGYAAKSAGSGRNVVIKAVQDPSTGKVSYVGVPKTLGDTGYTPYQRPIMANEITGYDADGNPITANRAYNPTNLNQAPQQLGNTVNAQQTRVAGAKALASERAKYQFSEQWNPEVGYVTPMSAYEIKARIDNGQTRPAAPSEAKIVLPALGKTAEVYNTLQNTRDAAAAALMAGGGQLHFDNVQLAELSALLHHAQSSLDTGLFQQYLLGLTNAASDAPTRNYVNNLKTMYEALIPLNGMLGGTSQISDKRYEALLSAAPGPSDVYGQDIEGKLQRLENTVALSTSQLPMMRGPSGFTFQDLNKDMIARRDGLPINQSLIHKVLRQQGIVEGQPQAAPQGQPQAAPVVSAPTGTAGSPKLLTLDIAKQYLLKYGSKKAAMAAAAKDGYSE